MDFKTVSDNIKSLIKEKIWSNLTYSSVIAYDSEGYSLIGQKLSTILASNPNIVFDDTLTVGINGFRGRRKTLSRAILDDEPSRSLVFMSHQPVWLSQYDFTMVDTDKYAGLFKKTTTKTKRQPGAPKIKNDDQEWFKLSLKGYKMSLNSILKRYGDNIIVQIASNTDCKYQRPDMSFANTDDYGHNVKEFAEFAGVDAPTVVYVNPTVWKIYKGFPGKRQVEDWYRDVIADKKQFIEEKTASYKEINGQSYNTVIREIIDRVPAGFEDKKFIKACLKLKSNPEIALSIRNILNNVAGFKPKTIDIDIFEDQPKLLRYTMNVSRYSDSFDDYLKVVYESIV